MSRPVDSNGNYTLHASDNTDYRLIFSNGIIRVENELGHVVCEFLSDDAPEINSIEVSDVEAAKQQVLYWMDEYIKEWEGYTQSYIDVFRAKIEAMEIAKQLINRYMEITDDSKQTVNI